MSLPRGIRQASTPRSRPVRRAVVSVAASVALLVSGAGVAMADQDAPGDGQSVAVPPAAPQLVDVTTGDQTILLDYQPVTNGSVRYQASPDGYSWFDCPDVSGTCGLVSLTNGRAYRPQLRAVGTGGPSAPAKAPASIPSLAPGVDPDKPAKLPRPRIRVTATFEADGNGLGVRSSRTKLGVGTLPKFKFSRAIKNKSAVERHLVVTATDDDGRTTEVQGAWGWTNDRTAVFRPKDYWPGNATIEITSTIDDAVLGKTKGKYLIGSKKLARTYSFRTDRSLIAEVDGKTKRMKVFIDGKRTKNFAVSLGKPGWETRNGAKVISTAKEPFKVYRSASLGLTDPDDFYELDAKWNTRLTPTGEFLHTATWAYGRLGRYNGSHGCTNMYEQDAKWVFDNTIPGDVITFRNTGGDMMESWNGPGGLWNMPWKKWLKKSALGSGKDMVDTSQDDGDASSARPASA